MNPAGITSGPFRVLLVEDNPADQTMIRRLLAKQTAPRFELTISETLADGVANLEQQAFDAVLLDLSLPDATRLEGCSRIGFQFPHTAIVVLTGLDDRELAVNAVQTGAQDYLVKRTIDGELLARALQYAAERKRIVTALEHSELRYRALVKAMTSIVWSADADGSFEGCNEDWHRFTGQTESEARGDGWLEAFHSNDVRELLAKWATARRVEQLFQHSARLWHADSEDYRTVEIRGVPISNGGFEWVGQITDVEDARRAELELRRNQRLAAIGTLSAGLAHEVNNPLVAAQISAQAARSNCEEHPERMAECLDNVLRSLDRCTDIMNNMMQFVRKGTEGRSRQNLQRIAGHVVQMMRGYAARNGSTIELHESDAVTVADINAIEFEQVLLNLIRNSVESTDEPVGIEIALETSSSGRPRVTVTDNGPGIPSSVRENIFDPFFTTREAGSGSGLGLSIVHGIVRDHDGTIEVETPPAGQGTTFVIEFPEPPAESGWTAKPA